MFDSEQNELMITLQGTATDEMDLILKSICQLIRQVDLKEMCEENQRKFDCEMKKILYAVVENYWLNGWSDPAHPKDSTSNSELDKSNYKELSERLITYLKETSCYT
ncbi:MULTISPECIES: hypothetical protein [Bacillota]|uniref:hypothetical protein n=1 Tax=Bacillota TaxID=1239 RepID=UPI0039F0D9F1